MTDNHLYLVDGSAYIFRAYHRLPPLTNRHGQPVGAVYGYTTMLWKLADDLNRADGPTHLAVVLDYSSTSFRNEMYDEYKAHRPEPPDDLKPQFPMIRDATRAFSLCCIEEEGVEADDVIATYTRHAVEQGWKVTIVSSDKDLMQLIRPGVDMLDTMKDQRIGPDQVRDKFGVVPERVGDVLALMGDSVDNVPGVPGIGAKTAAKLLSDYEHLEAVLAAAPSMKKSRVAENLVAHAEAARLSRRLVTLKDDCQLPHNLEEFALQRIPEEPLRIFLEHHGFTSLLKRIGQVARTPISSAITGEAGSGRYAKTEPATGEPGAKMGPMMPAPMPKVDCDAYECVTDMARLDHWIARGFQTGLVAFDTETEGPAGQGSTLVGFSLAVAPGEACYVPLGHRGGDMLEDVPRQLGRDEALQRIKPLLTDDMVLKVGQNLKYDMTVLARHGIGISPYDDTLVMSFCLDAGLESRHGLDEMAELHLGHRCVSYKELVGSGKKAISFAEVNIRDATRYAAEDADIALRLWHHLKLRLAPEGACRIYEQVDRPLVPVIARMECTGVLVDRAHLSRLSHVFGEQMVAVEAEAHELAGGPFTLGSPKQLGDILFDKMGLKGGKRGKSGQYSTDVTVLESLASQGVPIARKVLDWRQVSKLKATYTDALQGQIDPDTQRVHTSYSLTGAQTGRLSSTDPNLQNIPIRTDMGRQIREAFVAALGHVILSADYSQIELRLAAHIADVEALRDAFAQGADIHARTAEELFGEANRDTRNQAKTINFAILYGISRWGLARRLEVEPEQAQALIDTYFARFPGIQRYIAETLEKVRACGYTETLFGRKTWFPRINSKNMNERTGSERAAINAPIQGTSADIIKRAMVRMGPALEAAGLHDVKMLLQVHDELVFELPEQDVPSASAIISGVMANAAAPAVELSVPLSVDVGTGPNWGAAH